MTLTSEQQIKLLENLRYQVCKQYGIPVEAIKIVERKKKDDEETA